MKPQRHQIGEEVRRAAVDQNVCVTASRKPPMPVILLVRQHDQDAEDRHE